MAGVDERVRLSVEGLVSKIWRFEPGRYSGGVLLEAGGRACLVRAKVRCRPTAQVSWVCYGCPFIHGELCDWSTRMDWLAAEG